MPVLKADILSELDLVINERRTLLVHLVNTKQMDPARARTRLDSISRAKEIVQQYYKRIEEDLKLADELNKPQILQDMIKQNPAVTTLIEQLKLKVE